MTVPTFTETQFIDYIKDNGWEIASTDYWEEFNRLVFKKDGRIVVFQCKGGGKYFYPEVIKTCKVFEINPPTEHIHQYYRHMRYDDKECYCEDGKTNGTKFKDCHGKTD